MALDRLVLSGVLESLPGGYGSDLEGYGAVPLTLLCGACAGLCFCVRASADMRRTGQLFYKVLTFGVALLWGLYDSRVGPLPVSLLALCAYAASVPVFRFWPEPGAAHVRG